MRVTFIFYRKNLIMIQFSILLSFIKVEKRKVLSLRKTNEVLLLQETIKEFRTKKISNDHY